ncbi:beta subunit of fatty acid synthase, partial [Aureobasidium melanogenum]
MTEPSALTVSKVIDMIVLDNVGDGETIVVKEVLVGSVPDLLGDRAACVQLHTHTLFLRSLTSEDVGRNRLLNFCLTDENLVLGLLVAGLNGNDLATRDHTDVLQADLDSVVGKNHANKVNVEATNAANVVLSSPSLDQASDSSTGVHAVSDGAGKVGVLGEDTGNVDRVVVAGNLGIGLVGCRCLELKRSLAVERDRILEVDRLVNGRAVTLKVVDDGVAVRDTSLLNLDLADCLDGAEDALVLVTNQTLQTEGKGLTKKINLGILKAEPLLRLENCNVLACGEGDLHGLLGLSLESVLKVGVCTAVQELTGNLHDRLAITSDGTANLNHLTRGLVDDGVDLSSGVENVTLLQGSSARNHAEPVRKVNELEKITVNLAREDRLGDSLPSNNDGEVHRSKDLLARTVDEGFASVAHCVNEVVDGLASDSGSATIEARGDRGVEGNVSIAEPDLVVELLDAVVAGVHDLSDRSVTSLRVLNGDLVVDDRSNLNGVVGVVDLDHHTRSWVKDTVHRVGVESLALDKYVCSEEGVSPRVALTGEQRHPRVSLRKCCARGCRKTVDGLVVELRHGQTLNIDLIAGLEELSTEVLNDRNLGLITAVEVLKQVLDVALVHTIENLLDRLVDLGRVLDSHRTLENTGSANVLADNSGKVFGLPERILLEEELEAAIEGRHEWHRLLATALAELDEVLNILGVDELLVSFRFWTSELLLAVVVKRSSTRRMKSTVSLARVKSIQRFSFFTYINSTMRRTTSPSLVGLLPVGIVKTRGVNDSLLGSRGGFGLLGDHDTTTEQNTIEGHRRVAELACPLPGEVRVGVLGGTETTSSDEDKVGALADSAVHLEHRLVEVLERVPGLALAMLIQDWMASTEPGLNEMRLMPKVLMYSLATSTEGTPAPIVRASIGTPSARSLAIMGICHAMAWDRLLDLSNGCSHLCVGEVTTTGKFDLVTSVHGGSNELSRDSARGHTSNHDWGKTKHTTHLGVNKVDSILDSVFGIAVEDLGLVANFGIGAIHSASKNNADTSTILVAVGENTKAGDTTRTEIEDLGDNVVSGLFADVLASVSVVESNAQIRAGDDNVLEVLLEETVNKADLALGEGNAGLVKAGKWQCDGPREDVGWWHRCESGQPREVEGASEKRIERASLEALSKVSQLLDAAMAAAVTTPFNVRFSILVVQPAHDIQALGVELLDLGLSRQSLQVRSGCVLLDVALATEHCVDEGVLVRGLAQQSRLMGLDRPADSSSSGVRSGDGVNLVSTEECTLELVENKLEHLLVGARVITLIALAGDEANVAGYKLASTAHSIQVEGPIEKAAARVVGFLPLGMQCSCPPAVHRMQCNTRAIYKPVWHAQPLTEISRGQQMRQKIERGQSAIVPYLCLISTSARWHWESLTNFLVCEGDRALPGSS